MLIIAIIGIITIAIMIVSTTFINILVNFRMIVIVISGIIIVTMLLLSCLSVHVGVVLFSTMLYNSGGMLWYLLGLPVQCERTTSQT